jgi:Fur family ferric uptake transcriptional regulator
MTSRSRRGAPDRRPDIDTLRATLREAGLRSTAPRLAVLRYLEDAESPQSHADLVEALGGEGFDRTTIYRNLTDLAEVGLVTRSDLGDHVWRFELRRGQASTAGREGAHLTEHPHFTCTDCGTVACLPEGAVRVSSSARLPRAVAGKQVAVQLRGVCDRCD